MSNHRIKMFATANNTDQYAVAVDGLFGLFNKADAHRVYNLIESIEESPFGSCQLLTPGYVPINRFTKETMTESLISEHVSIDIERYIRIANERANRTPAVQMIPAYKRLADKREMATFFCL